jgi:hypothetical protein
MAKSRRPLRTPRPRRVNYLNEVKPMNISRRMLILDALAYRVRLFAWSQLVALGPPSNSYARSLRRLIRRLGNDGLIRRVEILTRPAPVIDKPLHVWRVGDPNPPIHEIQYQAEQRNRRPVEPVSIILGTQRLANALGGTCGTALNHHSAAHDLGVTAVFLHLWRTHHELALAWQGEDIVAPSRHRQKLPDAVLYDPEGKPVMAIEYIGDYPANRIQAFHDDCAARGLAYEVY